MPSEEKLFLDVAETLSTDYPLYIELKECDVAGNFRSASNLFLIDYPKE